jgi:hypothetical protein
MSENFYNLEADSAKTPAFHPLLTIRRLSETLRAMTRFAAHLHLTVIIHPAGCVAVLAR